MFHENHLSRAVCGMSHRQRRGTMPVDQGGSPLLFWAKYSVFKFC
jgi:hypothetical protein